MVFFVLECFKLGRCLVNFSPFSSFFFPPPSLLFPLFPFLTPFLLNSTSGYDPRTLLFVSCFFIFISISIVILTSRGFERLGAFF